MRTKYVGLVMCVVICGAIWCIPGFALDVPDGVEKDEALSQQALSMAITQFEQLQGQLAAIAESLPDDQQQAVTEVITLIDQKLQHLDRIDVYFAREKIPGEAYDRIYEFYKNTLSNVMSVDSNEVLFAITNVPPGMIPQQTMDSLMPLLEAGNVRAAVGQSGKSRVSILNVYIRPDTFELVEGTTLVIASDK